MQERHCTYELRQEGGEAVYLDHEEGREIRIPKAWCAGLYQAEKPTPITDEGKFLEAVLNPVEGPPLHEIAARKKAKTAAVIVSDATRCVPTAKVAKHLVDELKAGGVPEDGITFFVALGVHRDATEPEMRSFLGDALFNSGIRIENHDPYTPEKLIDLGGTSFGTPVKVGSGGSFAGTIVEVLNAKGRGTHGHIAIRTNYIVRAINYMSTVLGVEFEEPIMKGDKINAIYLKEEIGGFAVHLLQK